MVRFVIIAAVVAVAFTLYALVDAAMAPASRMRGVSKPAWILIIILLPVIGAVLWFTIGKDRGLTPAVARASAPDDDPRLPSPDMSSAELDEHMAELEARLKELDEERFPGEVDGPENDETRPEQQ